MSQSRRSWHSLFINPGRNYHHAICNCLERLLDEPADARALSVVERHVRHYLRSERGDLPGTKFQYKVAVCRFQGESLLEEDVLLSREESL